MRPVPLIRLGDDGAAALLDVPVDESVPVRGDDGRELQCRLVLQSGATLIGVDWSVGARLQVGEDRFDLVPHESALTDALVRLNEGLDEREQERVLDFVVRQVGKSGLSLAPDVSRSLIEARDAFRPKGRFARVNAGAPHGRRAGRIDRFAALGANDWFMEGWIFDREGPIGLVLAVSPEGEETPVRLRPYPRPDLPELVGVEPDHPGLIPFRVQFQTTSSGSMVEGWRLEWSGHDGERCRLMAPQPLLDPGAVPIDRRAGATAGVEVRSQQEAADAVERLAGASVAEWLAFGDVQADVDTTIVVAVGRRLDLIEQHLLTLARDPLRGRVELIVAVCEPLGASTVRTLFGPWSALHDVGFRVAIIDRSVIHAVGLELASREARGDTFILRFADVLVDVVDAPLAADLVARRDAHGGVLCVPTSSLDGEDTIFCLGVGEDGHLERLPLPAGVEDASVLEVPVAAPGVLVVTAVDYRRIGGLLPALTSGHALADFSLRASGSSVPILVDLGLRMISLGRDVEPFHGKNLLQFVAADFRRKWRARLPRRLPTALVEVAGDVRLARPSIHVADAAPSPAMTLRVSGSLPGGWAGPLRVLSGRREIVRGSVSVEGAFDLLVGLAGVPRDYEIQLVSGEEPGQREVASIRGNRRLHDPAETSIRPLLVTSIGRSGSTRLVALLGGHPDMVQYKAFMYEPRASSHWVRQMAELVQPASYQRSLRDLEVAGATVMADTMSGDWTDLREWFDRHHVAGSVSWAAQSFDGVARAVSVAAAKPGVSWFVEKAKVDPLTSVVTEIFPEAREVILVRDPRDAMCSMIRYAERNGAGWGWRPGQPEPEFARWASDAFNAVLGHIERQASKAIVIRYEDLVLEPGETARKICAHVGADSGQGAIDAMLEVRTEPGARAAHVTSESVAASVGRWRTDLAAETADDCLAILNDVVVGLGYRP